MVHQPEGHFPASEIQKMLWVTCQIHPDNPVYNIELTFSIKGPLQIEALQKSLLHIFECHQILRSSFSLQGDDLMQVIGSPSSFRLLQEDLCRYSFDEKGDKARKVIEGHVNRIFNLEKAPLVRALLVKTGENEYILSIVMHQIIFDTESKNIFLNDLSFLYSHYSDNNPEIAPLTANQYNGFSLAQMDTVKRNGYDHMIEFWKKKLAGQSGYLNLPSDFQRPLEASGDGSSFSFVVGDKLSSRLFDYSKINNTELDETLLAVYYILLHRISMQEDIITGIPFANRLSDISRSVIGCFTNILPLAVNITGKESFTEIVEMVSSSLSGAISNQELPYSFLLNEVRPKRDAGYNPLFQTGFSFEQTIKPELAGLETSFIDVVRYGSQLDLYMTISETGGEIKGSLAFNSDIFTEDTARRFTEYYCRLAESAINSPETIINRLPILSAADQDIILKQWNNTDRDYDLTVCLHRLFEKQVEKTPDNIAVVFKNKTLTYKELNEQANIIAHELLKAGVLPDRIVGIYMERSIEMVVSLYSILKAGGAYLPINPELPANRVKFIIDDAEPVIILTQPHLDNNIRDYGRPVLPVVIGENGIGGINNTNPESPVNSENLAYCIYTSGSTGKSKGALISHKSICNRLHWMQEYFMIDSSDRILQKTPFDFDVSVWEFFWPLISGAMLVVAEPGGHRDSAYLIRIINKERITVLHFVPAMLDIFLREPELSGCPGLRYVICSGEALSYTLQELFFSKIQCGLYNLYGPTEAAVDVTCWKCSSDYERKVVPIGFPVANTRMYILNSELQPVPSGISGDLYIGGIQLARGYLKRDDLTKERFIPDPFSPDGSGRLYRTGDVARWLPDGAIEYQGRSDFQIKLHGLRVEPGEIEYAIEQHQSISQAVVVSFGEKDAMRLVAYYTLNTGKTCDNAEIRSFLKDLIARPLVPSQFIELESFPKTSSGKIDRKKLPAPVLSDSGKDEQPVNMNSLEQQILSVWKRLLSLDKIGIHKSFFDIGGTSLNAALLAAELRVRFSNDISVVKIFQYPTIHTQAEYIANSIKEKPLLQNINERIRRENKFTVQSRGIAVIGMSGRFPGAESIDELWDNILLGKESVSQFSRDELDEVDEELANDPFYIPARGILTDIDKFDAPFFGISPNEAQIMDPQQRVIIETAWAALENAGYSPEQYDGLIGVYAGMGDGSYYLHHIHDRHEIENRVGAVTIEMGSEKDHIAPRISFLMNLHGPSLSIHTACSTALVVVDSAINALLAHHCDIAMAGGIDISVPQKSGQLYQEGGIFTKDGHCRPFDADASGTMFGEAVGIVVLKRFEDAIEDNDTIHAVILGSAVNHDGSQKASYLAPSVDGQAEVIALAQARAGIHPESIGFIEAHGTATPIGDPIEIEGLTKAFRLKTTKTQYCAIGSIKGNLGHTTNAAGITGLIKTIQVLKHKKIPPSINYINPNPNIDFKNSPFFVNTQLLEWPEKMVPARAGVSAFGYCGTNVHAVLEEFSGRQEVSVSRPRQLIMLSAKTRSSLNRMCDNFRDYLKNNPAVSLADAAFTLQKGRNNFICRKYIICSDIEDAVLQLEKPDPNRSGERIFENGKPRLVFVFPGQGSQYVNMGRTLYRDESLFRDTVDNCAEILKPHIGLDIRDLLYPEEGDEETALLSLKETKYTQPAIFIIEYALSQLWMSWNIIPEAMIGHSIGEFVCAALAGVFSLEDALKLVAARGRLMQDLPRGTMLSVLLDADTITKILPDNISIAAINGPKLCVVSGPAESVGIFEKQLSKDGVITRQLHSSHAFHSIMMDPVVEPFEQIVRSVKISEPQIPFVSTVTGKWISSDQATDPAYWANHLRATVKFSNAISEILDENPAVLLEVGPRSTSATLARQQIKDSAIHTAVASLNDTDQNEMEWVSLLKAIGMLWQWGIIINWDMFYKNEKRGRIPLPTYSFEKLRYWIEPLKKQKFNSAGNNSFSAIQENPMTGSDVPDNNKNDSRAVLVTKVREILEDISGKNIPETEFHTSFVDLGFDSLILTQIARNLTREFKVQISFRQIMEKYSSINVLTEYIQSLIPEGMLPELSAKQYNIPVFTAQTESKINTGCNCSSTSQNSGNLESIVIRQMNLIERLVALLEKQDIKPGLIKEILSENGRGTADKNTELQDTIKIKKDLKIIRSDNPPAPGAKLGKDENGNPAWYIPDPLNKGKFKKLDN